MGLLLILLLMGVVIGLVNLYFKVFNPPVPDKYKKIMQEEMNKSKGVDKAKK